MVSRHRSKTSSPVFQQLESRLLLNGTYDVPLSIPYDYSTDVTDQLQAFIDSVPDNSMIAFPSLGYNPDTVGYNIEGTVEILGREGLTIEGNGAYFRAFYDMFPEIDGDLATRNRAHWRIEDGSNDITLREMIVIGAHEASGPGSYDATREAQHGFDIKGSSNVLVEYCQTYDVFGDSVLIGGKSDHVTVLHGHFEGTGRQGMAVTQATNVLVQDNWIGEAGRGICDVEAYAAGWVVDNFRFIGNTTGALNLLWMPMGGQGYVGAVYVADNVATGHNGTPTIHNVSQGEQRGPFIGVNNILNPGGSPAPGFRFTGVDAVMFTGNYADFPVVREMTAVNLTDSHGAIVGNNNFEGALYTVDQQGTTDMVYEWDNITTADPTWESPVVVQEISEACYVGTVPYYDGIVTDGQVIAIWRIRDGNDPLSAYGLTTYCDYAAVIVDSAGNLVEGFSLDGEATYLGEQLPWIRPALATITIHPENQMVVEGQSAVFNVRPTNGTKPFSYQWQEDTGGGWTSIPGATNPSYTTDPAAAADDGTLIRCVVTNQAGDVNSDAATLTVAAAAAPTITAHPASVEITDGWKATFSIEAAGTDPKSYQWQVDGGVGWYDITGAYSSTYTTQEMFVADSGTTYRCVVTNAHGSATSNDATLTVSSALLATEDWTGSNNDPWAAHWSYDDYTVGLQRLDIDNNHGYVVGKYSDPEAAGVLLAYRNDYVGQDVEQLVRFSVKINGMHFGMVARRADADNDTYYYTDVTTTNTLLIMKMVNGASYTLLDTGMTIGNGKDGCIYDQRFAVETDGDNVLLKVKVWQTSSTDDWSANGTEPVDWHTIVDDGQVGGALIDAAGRFGLRYELFLNRWAKVDDYSATIEWGYTNADPVAGFTAGLQQGSLPPVVDFDASASHDPDGPNETIFLYAWDFGDSSNVVTSVFPTASHQYAAPGNYLVHLYVNDQHGAVTGNEMEVDAMPPSIVSVELNKGADQRSKIQKLSIQFSEPVSVEKDDLVIAGVDLTNALFTYYESTDTAVWDVGKATFDDAYYTATVSATGVIDAAGNELDTDGNGAGGDDWSLQFHRLAGDANGDSQVNVGDLGILAANYDSSGNWWELPADLDADGQVNVGDLGILAANYNTVLTPPGGGMEMASAGGTMGAGGSEPLATDEQSAEQTAASPAATGTDISVAEAASQTNSASEIKTSLPDDQALEPEPVNVLSLAPAL